MTPNDALAPESPVPTAAIVHGLVQAHREATTSSIQEVAAFLAELLSRRVTAFLAGVTSGKTVARWASGQISEIRDPASEQRLRTAYEIARLLLTAESPQTVRAWFIGINPHLDDTSPAEAIQEGRFRDALGAARAFLATG
jgi:hypothetical protein